MDREFIEPRKKKKVRRRSLKANPILSVGSELHVFRGHQKSDAGFIMGHEFTGEVVEVGKGVKSVQIGDKVVTPFTISWYDVSLCCYLPHSIVFSTQLRKADTAVAVETASSATLGLHADAKSPNALAPRTSMEARQTLFGFRTPTAQSSKHRQRLMTMPSS